jgi:hypothetical protein
VEFNAKAPRGKDARLAARNSMADRGTLALLKRSCSRSPVKRVKTFAPSHLCVFALKNPSTSKPTSTSANGAMGIIFHQQKLKFENLALFSGSLGKRCR